MFYKKGWLIKPQTASKQGTVRKTVLLVAEQVAIRLELVVSVIRALLGNFMKKIESVEFRWRMSECINTHCRLLLK